MQRRHFGNFSSNGATAEHDYHASDRHGSVLHCHILLRLPASSAG